MKLIYWLMISLLIAITCEAKDVNKEVDALFSLWNSLSSPGCAVTVIKDQKIVYERRFGSANLEYKIPISPKTVFAAASISKQFTAFAVALLVNKGKINLNNSIDNYLPDLPEFSNKITIRDLVYHTDGLRDQWDLLTFAGWDVYYNVVTNKDILKLVKMQQKLNFAPGTEYLYGNTGYTLLAQIVEKASGENFLAFCKNNIFIPLGMDNTFFNDDYRKVIPNLAVSYDETKDKTFLKYSYNISTFGATGLYTTVEDMAKWSNNFYTYKVGGKSVLELITKPGQLNTKGKLNYGFGLEITDYKGLRFIGHSGGDAGYNNYFITFPSENLSIIIFANLSSINSRNLAFSIADIFLESVFKTSNEKNIPSSDKKLTLYQSLLGYYYSKGTGTELKISTKNEHLYVGFLGQEFELKNTSGNEFILAKTPYVALKFIKEKNTFSLLYQNNLENISVSLKKVNNDNLAIGDLAIYKGTYVCLELNVTYEIDFSNDKLVLLRPRFVKSSLTPLFKDFLEADNGFWGIPYSVVFVKDNNDKISGFNISTSIVTNRVRNLFFKKIN